MPVAVDQLGDGGQMRLLAIVGRPLARQFEVGARHRPATRLAAEQMQPGMHHPGHDEIGTLGAGHLDGRQRIAAIALELVQRLFVVLHAARHRTAERVAEAVFAGVHRRLPVAASRSPHSERAA
ncbi:hypothetical protein D3C72_2088890 [compost metagenome]